MTDENCKRFFNIFRTPFDKKLNIIFGQGRVDGEGKFNAWIASADMVWDQVGPQLTIYSDNWKVFLYIQDVLDKLSKFASEDVSVAEFQQILLDCGFIQLKSSRGLFKMYCKHML